MSRKSDGIQPSVPADVHGRPADALGKAYSAQQSLFNAQPASLQRFLEAQGRILAEALVQGVGQVQFKLPDQVVQGGAPGQVGRVPEQSRQQMVGGLRTSLIGGDIRAALRQHLAELESSDDSAIADSARLMRFATAVHMVMEMLPAGRPVRYTAAEGEEIPTLPGSDSAAAESAITASSDAIAEEGESDERGELIVPYVPAARRFYLPQWVAFDEDGHLLVGSTQEAEAHIASMQRFINVLHAAVALAPYMVADEEYQRKRYGILGQLVNQGRSLARYETRQIIGTIKRRAAANDLNRGLSLSLPYFDDQTIQMKLHDFVVIPAGRIRFVPAFVVRAVQEEQAKVAQDTRLNASTRKYLLIELGELGEAFAQPGYRGKA